MLKRSLPYLVPLMRFAIENNNIEVIIIIEPSKIDIMLPSINPYNTFGSTGAR